MHLTILGSSPGIERIFSDFGSIWWNFRGIWMILGRFKAILEYFGLFLVVLGHFQVVGADFWWFWIDIREFQGISGVIVQFSIFHVLCVKIQEILKIGNFESKISAQKLENDAKVNRWLLNKILLSVQISSSFLILSSLSVRRKSIKIGPNFVCDNF